MFSKPVRLGWRLFSAALVAAACACASPEGTSSGGAQPGKRQGPEAHAPAVPADAFEATVVRVIDGDTFLASRTGKRVRVRLIGIDAPESVQPDAPVECFGRQSAEGLSSLMPRGTVIRASFQGAEHEDRFGRELWDVWLSRNFLQAQLVRKGYARARTYEPHTRYAETLAAQERVARAERVGLHGACRP